ncbi:MAG: 3-dehydroquinate synthase [Fimbriimonadaceae bacterium]
MKLTAPVRYVGVDEALGRLPGALVVTDENVARHYAGRILEGSPVLTLPSGESTKSLRHLEILWSWLAAQGSTRNSKIAALGGGVVGDLAGFAAATYMRGIEVVQVPTTLMAMVDSAHGGKTGINLKEGKNLAGAFYAPSEVVVAVGFLSTLPRREFLSGTAEVWKYGAISLPGLFGRLEASPLEPGSPGLAKVVQECVRAKLACVRADPLERKGLRSSLNFGHTVGHAIENLAGYGTLLHGEAVSIGMVAEAALGERLGWTCNGLAARLRQGLQRQGLPVKVPEGMDPAGLVEQMARDKKRTGDGLSFSLVTELGECKLVEGVAEGEVLASLDSR